MMEIVSKRNLIVLLSIAVIQYIIYTKFGFNPRDVYDDDDDEEAGDGYIRSVSSSEQQITKIDSGTSSNFSEPQLV